MPATVYLIPTVLDDENLAVIPLYVTAAIKNCDVFFAENEKTARRYFKKLWKEMVIDNYQWHTIHKAEEAVKASFIQAIKQNKTIGIVSEAGCPCIADPGQILVDTAQQLNATVVPLVGPSSILLALMASGLNGQSFQFVGYLPIDGMERKKRLKELEVYSYKNNCTQIFIETPYRNNQLLADMLQSLHPQTRLCIGADITSSRESILTRPISQWKNNKADYHKKQAIFLMLAQ